MAAAHGGQHGHDHGHGHGHGHGHDHGHDHAWHAEVAPEIIEAQSDAVAVKGVTILGVGVVGYLIVVACIVLVTVYFFSFATKLQVNSEEYPEKFGGQALHQDALDKRAAVLAGEFKQAGWVDATAGTVRLPIDQAKEKVIQQYANRPGQAAGGK